MAQLNGTGPDAQGKRSGRGLGKCQSNTEDTSPNKLGKGLGLRRQSGGGSGLGKRLKCGLK